MSHLLYLLDNIWLEIHFYMEKMLYIMRDVILGLMQINSSGWEDKFKRLLNIEDPLDKLILDCAKKGELKIGFVEVKPDRWLYLKKYFPSFVKH